MPSPQKSVWNAVVTRSLVGLVFGLVLGFIYPKPVMHFISGPYPQPIHCLLQATQSTVFPSANNCIFPLGKKKILLHISVWKDIAETKSWNRLTLENLCARDLERTWGTRRCSRRAQGASVLSSFNPTQAQPSLGLGWLWGGLKRIEWVTAASMGI